MRKILLGMAAISALAVGAPAFAQYSNGNYQVRDGYQGRDYGYANGNISMRIDRLQDRIRAGVQNRTISRQQAMRLDAQLRQLSGLERRYRSDGLSGWERSELQQRLNGLRQQIRLADRGGSGRYDSEDRHGDFYDRNNDNWDDRDSDRDGRWDAESRYDNDRDSWDDRDSDGDGRWQDDVDDDPYRGGR
ncbi:hypothetical protein [Sphingosinicella rhizophila]|uniref:Uncharacterized protein n=1 Tax=Sphingosinicella rhizophila TaxID=3050082 RepID=A0ABU3Q944_9SPHN|nr:hypothetical protein [Sphingosinicella sp. GR2756]MDT9599629.1 hypothetical protein [Sphingosinicella sp. GR2756]